MSMCPSCCVVMLVQNLSSTQRSQQYICRSATPILVTLAVVYGAGRLLLIPIQLIAVVVSRSLPAAGSALDR